MDQISALLKLADFSVAALAITALFMLINVLNRIMEQLNRLRDIGEGQTEAIFKLTDELHTMRAAAGRRGAEMSEVKHGPIYESER